MTGESKGGKQYENRCLSFKFICPMKERGDLLIPIMPVIEFLNLPFWLFEHPKTTALMLSLRLVWPAKLNVSSDAIPDDDSSLSYDKW